MPHSPNEGRPSATVGSLAEFARSLRDSRRSMPETLDEILRSALVMITGTTSACITTLNKGKRTVEASTDPLAEQLCRLQYELDQGPMITEARHLDVVVADDLDDESRWPRFAASAIGEGIRSLAAFQLYSNVDDLGVLQLYSAQTCAFDADAVTTGEALAAHAAIAMLAARDDEQFRSGLASRDIIGQAKGIIMERYDVDAIAAFELLSTLSQQQNKRLHVLAREFVDSEHPTSADL